MKRRVLKFGSFVLFLLTKKLFPKIADRSRQFAVLPSIDGKTKKLPLSEEKV